jgi:nucleoid-associated protein YgaU
MPQTYVTQPGDTLWDIATRFYNDGTRWPAIFEANRDQIGDDQVLYGGKTLTIPDNPTPLPHPTPGQSYVTQPGDTLWDIATRFYNDGTRWQNIYDANRGVIGDNPQMLRDGLTIIIPA